MQQGIIARRGQRCTNRDLSAMASRAFGLPARITIERSYTSGPITLTWTHGGIHAIYAEWVLTGQILRLEHFFILNPCFLEAQTLCPENAEINFDRRRQLSDLAKRSPYIPILRELKRNVLGDD